MIERLRERILAFISSPKDVPVLAGLSVGLYMLLFYYSQNFSLASSWQQLLFFIGYYIVLPVAVLYAGYKLLSVVKLSAYRSQFLFVGMTAFFMYFLTQLIDIGFSKKLALAGIVLAAVVLSFWVKKYYKLLIVLLFLMCLFNLYTIGKIVYVTQTASDEWTTQPDAINDATFKKRPNIYYIQPDGYTNADNFKGKLYNFDNSSFNSFLETSGFKIYNNFRSNYYTTLLSNSSMFSMKHHHSPEYMDPYGAREVIISDNAVLKVLTKNNYRTHFLTERPYLIISRPHLGYDDANFIYGELPYFMDGWNMYKDVLEGLKAEVEKNEDSGNFYFIESFTPGHINNNKPYSEGVEGERMRYINRIKEANVFLEKTIRLITNNDPGALIIIGADHGGFVGFEYMGQTSKLIEDKKLPASMFGAHLSIRWNDSLYAEYDKDLRSSVNLFRTVFSYLAGDMRYLDHLQDNSSYMRLEQPKGLYRYIDDKGNVVLEKQDNK